MVDRTFWAGRRVLLTGHTGFKGSWMSLWLESLGAETFGFALPPDQQPSLHSEILPFARHHSTLADIRDVAAITEAIESAQPAVVIHMAAQPLVRRSYRAPLDTWATNVMGSANLLEAARRSSSLEAVLVVTTDKVYRNNDDRRAFDEDDPLGGHDPYSASKAATEILVASYAQSFFASAGIPVATARAGNVLGGGDWSEDRLAPDVWRATRSGEPIVLRYPEATRPWQHVLDPLAGYLTFVERLVADPDGAPRALNFGPGDGTDAMTVAEVADLLSDALGRPRCWTRADGAQPAEMRHLALNTRRAIDVLDWQPRLPTPDALAWTAEWYRRYDRGESPRDLTAEQISRYEALG